MGENPHFKELLQHLNDFHVEYLIVGGYAVMKYTEPRYTKDLDIWVHGAAGNSERVFDALKKFGAPLDHDRITPHTFAEDRIVYQIGIAPLRIDVLSAITGIEFRQAWPNRVAGNLFGVPVHFISLADLIANKQASGRSSDLEQLNRIHQRRGPTG